MDDLTPVSSPPRRLPTDGTDRPAGKGRGESLADVAYRKELKAHYEHDYKDLFKQAHRIVRSREVADDIVQEAYTHTIEVIEQGTKVEHMGGWLHSCVRNLSLQHIGQRSMQPLTEDLNLTKGEAPVELIHARQRCVEVWRVINRLAPAQRSALVLAELRGMSHREIADALNTSEGAVRQLISRARTRIRKVAGRGALSLVLPLLLHLDADAGGYMPSRVKGRLLFNRANIRIFTGLTNVGASAGTFLQRSADVFAQPAVAFLAGALTIVALIAIEADNESSTQAGGIGAPVAAVTPAAPGPSEPAASTGQEGDSSSDDSATSGDSPVNTAVTTDEGDDTSSDESGGSSSKDKSSGSKDKDKSKRKDKDKDKGSDPSPPGTFPVTPIPVIGVPTITSPPSITGNPYVTQTLTGLPGSWNNSPTSFSFQWLRNGAPIAGATSSTYTLVTGDAGSQIGLSVTASNGGGSSTAAASAAVTAIGVPVYTNGSSTVTVVGGGPPVAGAVIICSEGVWTNNPTSIIRQLRKNGVSIVPLTYQHTLVAPDDFPSSFDCVVTATNPAGSEMAITDTFSVT